jgi:hypothetical protein
MIYEASSEFGTVVLVPLSNSGHVWQLQGRGSRGGHELPRVLQEPAMLYAMQYALHVATPETAFWPFQWWPPAGQATCGCLLPPWTPHGEFHAQGDAKWI